ncbi:hypothetical protein FXV77_05355 [Sphingobacterium phlebotomi]|uniref:Uncharacterized protein n=1 Tax=Sphingobacterium phlebotomi TaxID=2605433 RepID=A0A5D4HAT2_9SPHI|nr:hypothetical protein [Sphingobacterium phlebotomi]TYR37432.1 hypothetical protein FXV77_05355 [Sphingobacterium phlebotomi]
MKNSLLILTASIFVFSSCKNETVETTHESINREEIRQVISLHSKGLARIKENKLRTKSHDVEAPGEPVQPGDPVLPVATPEAIAVEVSADIALFAEENNLAELAFMTNAVPGFNLDQLPTKTLSEDNLSYSQNFYILANQIVDLEGSSYQDLQSQINAIESTTAFQNLTNEEKTILISASETLLDSYLYWSEELDSDNLVPTKGPFSRLWRFVKSDARGAVSGAVIGTAYLGYPAGTVGGALVGGLAFSAFASELATVNEDIPFAQTTVRGILVPSEWDVVVLPSGELVNEE